MSAYKPAAERRTTLNVTPCSPPWLLSPDDTDRGYPRAFPAYNYSMVDIERPALDDFPAFAEASPLVVELSGGDALFVAGGWWHHVRGHGLNISVTTMWLPPVVPKMLTRGRRLP